MYPNRLLAPTQVFNKSKTGVLDAVSSLFNSLNKIICFIKINYLIPLLKCSVLFTNMYARIGTKIIRAGVFIVNNKRRADNETKI